MTQTTTTSVSRQHRSHSPPPFPTRRSSDLQGTLVIDVHPRLHAAVERANPLEARLDERHGAHGAASDLGRRLDHAERRSEEHTSELQSLAYLVCRLLLEKKKI